MRYFLLLTFVCTAHATTVTLDLQHPIGHIGPMYIGVTMNTGYLREPRFPHLNLNSKSLRTLTRGLSPAFFRVGGNMADSLVFEIPAPPGNISLSAQEWQRVNQLTQSAGWDLIFDLNVNRRHGNAWDPTNARALLRYSSDHGIKIRCFQLGNEVNANQHKFNYVISPERLHRDYHMLKNLLHEFPHYRNSCIVGPEVTKLRNPDTRKYFEDFMEAEHHNPVLDAIGLHHYYINSMSIPKSVANLTDPHLMNRLLDELQVANAIKHRYAPGTPLWFTETSCTFGTDLKNDFVSGFTWLDKLGLSAQHGFSAVIRQTFFNALMDIHYNPLPDYFATLLHKRLIQGPVLKVTTGSSDWLRVYAHCANHAHVPAGAVTVMAINLQPHNVTLTFSQFQGQEMQLYMLTPGDSNGLTSKHVALNGKRLDMANEELPPLLPKTHTGSVTMAAMSFGFIVFPHANQHVCRH